MSSAYLLEMLCAFAITIAIETPILLVGLSRAHPLSRRLFAGVWLTACTYPVVWLTLPAIFPPEHNRLAYLLVAETFAPLAECALFMLAFHRRSVHDALPARPSILRDCIVIVLANLASFGFGELVPLRFA